ncbi:hypothetical protein ACTDI4_18280 [Mesorhizobium sp. PUT5]|uniref:hypothetical protein n=1 Tax=Mesorhizobium sp. PUT5 TaxID=3454629 RepID=UPI003FA46EE6
MLRADKNDTDDISSIADLALLFATGFYADPAAEDAPLGAILGMPRDRWLSAGQNLSVGAAMAGIDAVRASGSQDRDGYEMDERGSCVPLSSCEEHGGIRAVDGSGGAAGAAPPIIIRTLDKPR